jgi:hypothetical protein
VTALDDSIQTVMDALKQKGILDNTPVIFSSDNGGAQTGRIANNGPLRAGKGTIYEGGLRVPAFVLWPGHVSAGRTDEPLHVNRAMLMAFKVPKRDRYQIYHAHPESNLIVQDTGLGIERTSKIVILTLTSMPRSLEMKQAFYTEICRELKDNRGIT